MGNTITCHCTDDSVFRYCAVDEERFGAEEMGWILIVENSSDPIRPHKLSAAEAYGDLVSMEMPEYQAHASLSSFTKHMRELATDRANAHDGDETEAWQRRADQLTAQLEELDAVAKGERDPP